jgi:proline iminopeptidase
MHAYPRTHSPTHPLNSSILLAHTRTFSRMHVHMQLRELLRIETWVVFGGSWGSTLSLTYAETHPTRVSRLVLRGIFTLRRSELEFFYQEGSSWLFADAWEDYVAPIPVEERGDMMAAYYRRLTGDNSAERDACALVRLTPQPNVTHSSRNT